MSVFAIGDIHLSFSTDKPMDIFSGWQDYESRLEKNWIRLVEPEDTVIIPGDISWALNLEDTKADFGFLDRLPGTKIIGKGNHDFWWDTLTKMNRFLEENGFTTIKFLFNNAYDVEDMAICGTRGWFFDDESDHAEKILNREVGRLKLSIEVAQKIGKELVVFLHYPPLTGEKICEPIMEVLIENNIKKCYYAHLHGNTINYAFKGIYKGIEFDLVSADALGFTPKLVTLSKKL
ncbi:MAG: serine/threonine protein phosphatase [Ruminococcaceae bacterium]|nr:serine/threonine protein phosphatase [Oscillospiraceae bacterium]